MNKKNVIHKAAISLSVITILTELWRSFLDAMFVLPTEFNDENLLYLASLIFTLLFGGWIWALVTARTGKRGALIVTFLINAVVLVIIPISWLFFYCPSACRADAGIFNLANTLNLIFGVAAGIALGLLIWGKQVVQIPNINEVTA
jgi:hypothetical protein